MKNNYNYKLDFEMDSNQLMSLETGLQKIFDDMYNEELIKHKPSIIIKLIENKLFLEINLNKGYKDY